MVRLATVVCAVAAVIPAAAAAQHPARAYVANQENATVTVLEPRSGRVLRTIDLTALGFSANCKPHHVAVEPDGSYWYLTLIADGRVLKLDREARVVAEVRTQVPGMIALVPGSSRMLVGRSMSAVNPPSSVLVVDRGTMTIVEELELPFPRPHALAVDAGGAWAYTASLGENRFAAIDLATFEVRVHAIDGPPHAVVQFAVSPDRRWLVGSGQLSGQVLVFDRAVPAEPRLVRQVPVGASPWDPVFSPDGRSVWLANLDANTVTVLDPSDWSVAHVISDRRLAQPNGLALTPDGRWAVVANRNQRGDAHLHDASHDAGTGFAALIDTRRRRVTGVLTTGRYAAGVATGP